MRLGQSALSYPYWRPSTFTTANERAGSLVAGIPTGQRDRLRSYLAQAIHLWQAGELKPAPKVKRLD